MAAGGSEVKPISLFFSYSHRDEALRDELGEHLFPLERAGLIEVWHDREMLPGDNVDDEIAQKLRTADVILVRVSPSFIRSSYCYDNEFKNAIKRHNKGEARVVPVIVRPCQWQLTPLRDLLAMPTDGRAVIEWPSRDTAFNDVAAGVTRLAKAMQDKGISAAKPAAAGAKPTVGQVAQPPPDAPATSGEASPAIRMDSVLESEHDAVARNRPVGDLIVFCDVNEPWCPEMVALPAGKFLMGSPFEELGRGDSEGPQHEVTFAKRFALGKYAVTFAQYDHYCEVAGTEKPEDRNWSRGQRPVINVNWRDAMAYCEWLAKETGQPYRLPSEAEWEYACRAGTTTPFSFGATISVVQANYDGNYTYGNGTKGAYRKQTVPVGVLPANPWGLHEMHGNVWEWVEDVWHDSYAGAPVDGSAWTDGEGKESSRVRVGRGGSWSDDPRYLRSAGRDWSLPDLRDSYRGFRVARTLD
jgi:formylglycine-generating enzyme required for sulfatase activity